MKQKVLSIITALCLCMSALPEAHAWQEEDFPEEAFLEEETEPVPYADGDVPAPREAYEAMIALKEDPYYAENAPWTNETHEYTWNGGKLDGTVNGGRGCVAFAFRLSDAAFGLLPARMFPTAGFSFSDVKVGDILRVNNDAHTVIVLQVYEAGVEIAEANYHLGGGGGVVHWGRTMTREEVEAASHYITRYPENYIPPDDPGANEQVAGGTLSGGLSWGLTKAGTLTISGNGAIPDYSGASEQPWSGKSIQKIVIEDGVTGIGSCAFMDTAVYSVEIPDSVGTIGNSAFQGSSMISVTIPASVESIGDSAFRACPNLAAAMISEGVVDIGENTFRGCEKLKSIALPASIERVGAGSFYDCTELTQATFASGNKQVQLGDNLFTRCWSLASVTLPQNIDRIGEGMFQVCNVLPSLVIPRGATEIGGSAFASCGSLTEVTIPDSVTRIGIAAFSNCGSLRDIYYGGSEEQWNSISKLGNVASSLENVTIHYNSPGTIPHIHSWDSGWSSNGTCHWHECVAGNCNITDDSDKDGYGAHDYDDDADDTCNTCGYTRTTEQPGHEHIWGADWSNSSTAHWHECLAENCGVTDNSLKDGYGAHSFGGWVDDGNAAEYQGRYRTCTICGYRQADSSLPTGGSPSTDGPSQDRYSRPKDRAPASNSNSDRNPDGSATTVRTDSRTGTVTETTRYPDGSQTVVETRTDGTVTTRETDQAGNKTETVSNPDGSGTVIVEQLNGTTANVTTDTNGRVEAVVGLPAPVVSSARQNGWTIPLPIPAVPVARDTGTASAITVKTGSDVPASVEIPAVSPGPGTVAVIVRADGTEEVVKTSVSTADAVAVSLPDGATVKIVDNSRAFLDVSDRDWALDAIRFVSARELFDGTTAETFSPEAPMTRAMLITVLARFDGADTTGGATWYEKGMEWAVANGISDGGSPEGSITREQLVTMLWRYAGSPAAAGELSSFTDTERLSGFAQEAMRWAVENGIIGGYSDGRLEPQGQATRAQVAQILMNFIRM